MKALFAGTFDPITTGHMHLIQRAATLFCEVEIAVCTNAAKHTMFNLETRVAAVKAAVADMKNVTVSIETGLIADYAKSVHADVIIKGVRNGKDFDWEQEEALANRALSGIETMLLCSDSAYDYVSSTLVREMIRNDRDCATYVPDAAYEVLKSAKNA